MYIDPLILLKFHNNLEQIHLMFIVFKDLIYLYLLKFSL